MKKDNIMVHITHPKVKADIIKLLEGNGYTVDSTVYTKLDVKEFSYLVAIDGVVNLCAEDSATYDKCTQYGLRRFLERAYSNEPIKIDGQPVNFFNGFFTIGDYTEKVPYHVVFDLYNYIFKRYEKFKTLKLKTKVESLTYRSGLVRMLSAFIPLTASTLDMVAKRDVPNTYKYIALCNGQISLLSSESILGINCTEVNLERFLYHCDAASLPLKICGYHVEFQHSHIEVGCIKVSYAEIKELYNHLNPNT